MKERTITWREFLLDILDGAGLVVTDEDAINDILDMFGTSLDQPTCVLEVLE